MKQLKVRSAIAEKLQMEAQESAVQEELEYKRTVAIDNWRSPFTRQSFKVLDGELAAQDFPRSESSMKASIMKKSAGNRFRAFSPNRQSCCTRSTV
jgi:hypothetical protein